MNETFIISLDPKKMLKAVITTDKHLILQIVIGTSINV